MDKQVKKLIIENMKLKSDVAYLTGKITAYEWFLKKHGFIKGDEE